MVALAASVAIKVLLLNEMLAQGVKPVESTRRLNVPRQEVTRLLNPRHATRSTPLTRRWGPGQAPGNAGGLMGYTQMPNPEQKLDPYAPIVASLQCGDAVCCVPLDCLPGDHLVIKLRGC